MEPLHLVRQAIDYIEEHLTGTLEIEDIARAALSSRYHFQRMFHVLTGFTVTEYIRNRRLTLAAEELAGTDCRVIDAALKYGYESPEAFVKAFQRLHGVTPSAAKKRDMKLKAFSRISFHIEIKGECELNYRLVEELESTVIGKSIVIHADPYKEIPRSAIKSGMTALTTGLTRLPADRPAPCSTAICMIFRRMEPSVI